MQTRTITRRKFIRNTAASAALAVAAPSIISATALGNENAAPASERLTIGFIGLGKQSRVHTGYLGGKRECQVLAVCDVDTTRRNAEKHNLEKKYEQLERKNYGGITDYVDFHELIAQKDIDAVVITTPDHWHTAPIIEACKAKKDIYCEKPLTLTIGEAKLVIEAVRKYDRVLQTGSQQRSSGEFKKAVDYVRSGRIGKLQKVYVVVGPSSKSCDLPEEPMEPGLEWDRWLGQAPKRPYNSVLSPRGVHDHYPNWRSYREYAGGGMTDFGAHQYDIAQWGMDMDGSGPVEIIPPEDPKAEHGLRYIYANGVEVIHSDKRNGRNGVHFVGTDGEIWVDRGSTVSTPDSIYREPLKKGTDSNVYESHEHHEDWLKCIKTRSRPVCDVEIGARTATVCHLGNLAYWHRRALKWDPAKWEFPGDAEANGWINREQREPYTLPTV